MLLGTVLLAGCSTSTPSLDETDQVPKERLYNYQFRDDGDAFLVVSRDREFLGSVCNTRLIIDSRLAAEIQAGESARFRLPAGLRVVSVQGDGIPRRGAQAGGACAERADHALPDHRGLRPEHRPGAGLTPAQRKKPPVGGFFMRGVYSLTAFSTFSDADQIR
ncbi:hypothetical protein PALA47_02222 [Pseudomonas aeruginosa]|nr:hypothetical protein PALA7_02223 [Pseudomonas aeruginosa]WBJ64366.1 hypothetical protein PALA47_02222 [Pseudomonas aeruginosa]